MCGLDHVTVKVKGESSEQEIKNREGRRELINPFGGSRSILKTWQ